MTGCPLPAGDKPITVGGGTMRTQLAYLRLYSTLVPLNSPPPARADGDMGDWEFDGALTIRAIAT